MELTDSFDLSILWSSFSLIIPIVILVACIYFVSQKQGPDSIFMLIGSIIRLLVSGFHSVIVPILVRTEGVDFYSNQIYFTISSIFGFIGSACFAVGLFILIVNYTEQFKKENLS